MKMYEEFFANIEIKISNIGRKAARGMAIFLALILTISALTACGGENGGGISIGGKSQAESSSTQSGSNGSGTGSDSNTNNSGNSTASSSGLGSDAADEQQAVKDAFNAYVGKNSVPTWVGTQVYNDEVVNIWYKGSGSEDLQTALDIYVYDYNDIGKIVARGVPNTCVGNWFYAREEIAICVMAGRLLGYDEDGTRQFDINVEGEVSSIVQLTDGTIVLLVKMTDSSHGLAVLNMEEKKYTMIPGLNLGKDKLLFLAPGENGLVLLNQTGFFDVNIKTGEMTEQVSLTEYDFKLDYNLKSFRMLEGGALELLYQNHTEIVMPIDIEKYRTVVTVQVGDWLNPDLELLLNEFNKKNPKYYAMAEIFQDEGTLMNSKEAVYSELSKGNGADVITSYGLNAMDLQESIRLGYFEDLTSYMAESGIYEEDYFPCTFAEFKHEGGIYGGVPFVMTVGLAFDKDVLDGRDVRNLEDLVDALLANVEPSVFHLPANSALWYLLEASDSLGGTVDWENKTCDFRSDFFSKLLEVCKLYDGDDNSLLPKISSQISTSSFFGYLNEEQRDLSGDVYLGYFFDNGIYPSGGRRGVTVHLNSQSDNKEGAWAVIAWLLSEEAQDQDDFTWNGTLRSIPSNIYAFETVAAMEMKETAIGEKYDDWAKKNVKYRKYRVSTLVNGKYVEKDKDLSDEEYCALYNLKEQDVEEMREILYRAQIQPARTEPILNLIYEEAAEYFEDKRSLADTCDAIQEKVQAYLDGTE